MDRREYLKPFRFANAEKRREIDSKNFKARRSIRRTANFNLRRDIDQEDNQNENENVPPKSNKLIDRKLALQKFRAEKEENKKALKSKKKPPFVVGIFHHGSSPLLKNADVTCLHKKDGKTRINHEVRTHRVTRAIAAATKGNVVKEKPNEVNELQRSVHLFKAPQSVQKFPFKDNKKTVFTFQPSKIVLSGKKLTSPQTPTVLKRSAQKKVLNNLSKPSEAVKNLKVRRKIETTKVEELQANIKKSPVLQSAIEVNNEQGINEETANQVAFQNGRLQSETTRLLELAEKWQAVVLKEILPQEVVDEVDSIVGQTRLLTSDKFQQFRRLIIQYEQQTGTHPVTVDDLNGFWDMVYLQVESLDKKYAALDILQHNNWVKPEPPSRKKRRPVKTTQINKKEKETEKLSTETQQQQPSGDQPVHTPAKNVGSVLLSRKRTHSNSPSAYIAMRLSGIGRTANGTPGTCGTPKNKLIKQEIQTSEKKHRSFFFSTSQVKIEETNNDLTPGKLNAGEDSGTAHQEDRAPQLGADQRCSPTVVACQGGHFEDAAVCGEHIQGQEMSQAAASAQLRVQDAAEWMDFQKDAEVPEFTPRRSVRLMNKLTEKCLSCLLANTERSDAEVPEFTPRRSVRLINKLKTPEKCLSCQLANTERSVSGYKSSSKKRSLLAKKRSERQSQKEVGSPLEDFLEKNSKTELTQHQETVINGPSGSRVKFSLRPSILTVSESNNDSEMPKKKMLDVIHVSPTISNDGEMETMFRRSTRQSRKVTFEPEVKEKRGGKLPATPFRKPQPDS